MKEIKRDTSHAWACKVGFYLKIKTIGVAFNKKPFIGFGPWTTVGVVQCSYFSYLPVAFWMKLVKKQIWIENLTIKWVDDKNAWLRGGEKIINSCIRQSNHEICLILALNSQII